jgi:hypothetical protein
MKLNHAWASPQTFPHPALRAAPLPEGEGLFSLLLWDNMRAAPVAAETDLQVMSKPQAPGMRGLGRSPQGID